MYTDLMANQRHQESQRDRVSNHRHNTVSGTVQCRLIHETTPLVQVLLPIQSLIV